MPGAPVGRSVRGISNEIRSNAQVSLWPTKCGGFGGGGGLS